MPKAVADALDDWIMRRFGKESSHHGAGLFLNLLAEEGYEVTPQASSAERSEEEVCRCAPTPSAISTPVVSYDSLVDWVTRLEVKVKPVNGVVTIIAESMADAFADFLSANGVEVHRDDL